MKITKRPVVGMYSEGSCNFCNKGEISISKTSLIYPYNDIVEIQGTNSSVRFCKECFEKLQIIKYDEIEYKTPCKTIEI